MARVLFSPEAHDLGQHLAVQLGTAFRAAAPAATKSVTQASLAVHWNRSRQRISARVQALRDAARALGAGNLDPDQQRLAEREAHKLVGTLGTYGFERATLLAREAEAMLGRILPLKGKDRTRLLELADQIDQDLEGPLKLGPAEREGERLWVCDPAVSEELLDLCRARRIVVRWTDRRRQALTWCQTEAFRVAVLDLAGSEEAVLRIKLLEELARLCPRMPIVVRAHDDGPEERVRLAGLGASAVLGPTASVLELIERAQDLSETRPGIGARILALDDDPEIRVAVGAVLRGLGYDAQTSSEPLELWEHLETFQPDLLILDVDMPTISGIDLCRALRSEARWDSQPILFLTAYNNSGLVRRLFQAGADDYLNKPVVEAELAVRVGNRLTRALRAQRTEAGPH